MSPTHSARVRLHKFLSDAGVCSRRQAEELILAGRVLVNDEVVDRLPAFVTPGQDRVVVDGTPVHTQRLEHFIVHKPKGVVCTNRDPAGRIRAVDLLPDLPVRLFPVGRLDVDSTGLLIMTNDGELAQRVAHPRLGIPKIYRAEVRGRVTGDLPAQMEVGVYLSEGKARASDVQIVHRGSDRSVLMITLREGRNRQIRRMLARLGHPVKALKRVQIGPLSIRRLPLGAARRLTSKELDALREEIEKHGDGGRERPRRPRKGRAGELSKRGASTARTPPVPKRKTPAPGGRVNVQQRKPPPGDRDGPRRRRRLVT